MSGVLHEKPVLARGRRTSKNFTKVHLAQGLTTTYGRA